MSDYGSRTKIHELVSEENSSYNLRITLPNNYDHNKTYKTLYYLDAWWLSEIVAGSYAILQLSDKVEPIILIGITLDGNLKDWNIQRTLDFTPSAYDISKMKFQMRAGREDDGIILTRIIQEELMHFLFSRNRNF